MKPALGATYKPMKIDWSKILGVTLGSCAALYAGVTAAAVCIVYENMALLTAVVAAYVAGDIFASRRADKYFYQMRDEAEAAHAIARHLPDERDKPDGE